ncbi:23S rRNA (guanosine(2251)-2'-O)-methyltransferase RlmB [Proteiniborus sp. MB09-C3]|uniref:23S rRNA (guanosine(2251)-2'-O)-methyltransferase RlmB n=1 Tax=Proteiniborus sp. MB09-C3 TaxID=3050072 RepID=UPI00255781F2|nr:23S rRNA (guanosine(2251)-2'-O)-methyltransferase RlmB [Proteiniborus sp. MB09-C3]WIV11405.1 23S rRNA (guanosine(2251)-2'-O)-methyltransferase RlmB [Proteiniborus sp. MB09-C3]
MYEMITSSSNSIIKEVKSLYRKKDRWMKKNFFVEGIRAVRECVDSNANIAYLVYSDMLFSINGGKELLDKISQENYNINYISDKLFNEISDTEKPQGILAVVSYDLKKIDEIIKDKENFLILLDRVQDPGNMGTIIRTADAFGSNGIIVTEGCVDIFNPKTIRSTMGSIFHIPLLYYKSACEAIKDLKDRGITVITTSLDANEYCFDVDFKRNFALIIGNEASGVSNEIIADSDLLIKIPMPGEAESLNAAIASSVIMYEVLRQRLKF